MSALQSAVRETTETDLASRRIRIMLDLLRGDIPADGGRFWAHPRIRVLYPRYLVAVHSVIRASCPIFAAARDAALRLGDSDPVARLLAQYLDKHIEEEADHDDWLLEDLQVLGVPARDVFEHVPSPAIAALSGAQYYYIWHYHPVAILGYLAMMEGFPPTKVLMDAAERRTGHPPEAFRVLRLHGDLDIGHKDDIDDIIDDLPLNRRQLVAITTNAAASFEQARQMMDELTSEDPVTWLRSEREHG